MNRTKEIWRAAEKGNLCNLGREGNECGKPARMSCRLGSEASNLELFYCQEHWRRVVGRRSAEDQRDAYEDEHGYPPGTDLLELIHSLGAKTLRVRKAQRNPGAAVFLKRLRKETVQTIAWLEAWLEDHEPIESCHFDSIVMMQEEFEVQFDGPIDLKAAWLVGFEIALEVAADVDQLGQ